MTVHSLVHNRELLAYSQEFYSGENFLHFLFHRRWGYSLRCNKWGQGPDAEVGCQLTLRVASHTPFACRRQLGRRTRVGSESRRYSLSKLSPEATEGKDLSGTSGIIRPAVCKHAVHFKGRLEMSP